MHTELQSNPFIEYQINMHFGMITRNYYFIEKVAGFGATKASAND